MVATTYYLDPTESPKTAFTQENLRTLFSQIESELQRSDIYQRAIASLQQDLETPKAGMAQAVMKAVSREAIRLAFRRFMGQFRVAPPPPKPINPELLTMAEETPSVEPLHSTSPEPAGSAITLHPSASSVTPGSTQPPSHPNPYGTPQQRARRLSRPQPKPKSEQAQHREAILQEIGQTLKQAREAKFLSQERLHHQTWVPLHKIKALESGDIEQLPEDIYIEGFIYRLADALGLDGETIVAPLISLNSNPTVIPSWQRSFKAPLAFSPTYLYLSYAALMVGAVGGLSWLSQQESSSEQTVNQRLPWLPSVLFQPAQEDTFQTAPSSSIDNRGGIAVPEVIERDNRPFR